MKLLNNVVKFSEDSKELYLAFKDYFDQTQAEKGVLGKKFSDVSKDEKEKVINKLFAEELERRSGVTLEQFDGRIAHYAKHPTVKSFADAIVDYMIDMILPEVLFGSLGLIGDIRFGGWYDSFTFNIENNALFAVSKAGRRQRTAPAQKLYNTTATIAPENHELTVITNLPAILAGRESIAKFVMKAVKSIEAQMLYEAYDTFNTTMDSATIPSALKLTTYEEKALISLCEKVTAYNGGKKAVIVGSPVALKSILPSSTNTRILLDDEFVKMGSLRTFNNYDVISLENFADYTKNDYSMKLKDNRIHVVSPASDKLIKIAVQGDTLSNQDGAFDTANLSQTASISKSWGIGCITNSVAGVVQLS